MNQLIISDSETGKPAWALCILEPEELARIANRDPAMIDMDPDGDSLPMLTIACEPDTPRLDEVLSTNDPEQILKYLRSGSPKHADTVVGKRREDYEHNVNGRSRRSTMLKENVVMAHSCNIAPASVSGPADRLTINLSVDGLDADVCYELTNPAKADQVIELLIEMRNRLWPKAR